MDKQSIHGSWRGGWLFIFAATGSAVGLGNVWKFPYMSGENGGAAFVLVYLACILLIGIPILAAEIIIGRNARKSPVNALRQLARESGVSATWQFVGWMGVIAGIMILSFYSVVSGWILSYVEGMGTGRLAGMDGEQSGATFGALLANPKTMLIWHTVFILSVVLVVAGGVRNGLGRVIKVVMPMLFLLLCILLGYSIVAGNFDAAWKFLFHFDISKLSWGVVLSALGHAFFTLSLGMGAMMAYGAYMDAKVSIGKTVLVIAGLDTLIALIAGLVIFPIVFANGLDAAAGPGLMFISLPVAFGAMQFGQLFGFLFFVFIAIAAWTSAFSMIEPCVAWMVEKFESTRIKVCSLVGLVVWLLGIAALGSFNFLADFKIFKFNVFDFLDFATANIMLPLGGLLIALFVGHIVQRKIVEDEMAVTKQLWFDLWYYTIRYITPVLVSAVLITELYGKLFV